MVPGTEYIALVMGAAVLYSQSWITDLGLWNQDSVCRADSLLGVSN